MVGVVFEMGRLNPSTNYVFCKYWTWIKIEISMTCVYKRVWSWNKSGAGAINTVENEVFLGLLHENVHLVGRKLTFGGGRNCSRCGVNEQIFGQWGNYPLSPTSENSDDIHNICNII